jgi:hypothetical protein
LFFAATASRDEDKGCQHQERQKRPGVPNGVPDPPPETVSFDGILPRRPTAGVQPLFRGQALANLSQR